MSPSHKVGHRELTMAIVCFAGDSTWQQMTARDKQGKAHGQHHQHRQHHHATPLSIALPRPLCTREDPEQHQIANIITHSRSFATTSPRHDVQRRHIIIITPSHLQPLRIIQESHKQRTPRSFSSPAAAASIRPQYANTWRPPNYHVWLLGLDPAIAQHSRRWRHCVGSWRWATWRPFVFIHGGSGGDSGFLRLLKGRH